MALLHIVDLTADVIGAGGFWRVGLLGTAFTMEQDFYKGRPRERQGIDVLVPDEADRQSSHRIIYQEPVAGIVRPESRNVFCAVIARLIAAGIEVVIIGCTEIMLLVDAQDSAVPLFDITTLHAEAAATAATVALG